MKMICEKCYAEVPVHTTNLCFNCRKKKIKELKKEIKILMLDK